jgi:hypothetical protein
MEVNQNNSFENENEENNIKKKLDFLNQFLNKSIEEEEEEDNENKNLEKKNEIIENKKKFFIENDDYFYILIALILFSFMCLIMGFNLNVIPFIICVIIIFVYCFLDEEKKIELFKKLIEKHQFIIKLYEKYSIEFNNKEDNNEENNNKLIIDEELEHPLINI